MSEIKHDKANRQFILEVEGGHQAVVDYTLENGLMRLVYSKVPSELQGKGIGKELVEKTFQKLTDEGFEAQAVCSYIRIVAMRSDKWKEIIKY